MRIETNRIIITKLSLDMARVIHLNSLDDDNRHFVPDEVFETEEEAYDTIKYLIDIYEKGNGPLVYPILLKDGTNIGYVQAIPIENNNYEIGYHIASKYTKKGFASEAVLAFLPIIMKQLGITQIYGVCLSMNKASCKVLERCGFIKAFEGVDNYQGNKCQITKYVYYLSPKDIVVKFFEDGYTNKNYDFILNCVSKDYIDNSPANARSNIDAVNILKIVANQFSNLSVKFLDVFAEGNMVATRVLYEGIHTGNCMSIEATNKKISFEALENFKIENGKIIESWGYWPDKEIENKLKN